MEKSMRNYLVSMIDESDNAFFTTMVRAECAFDAATHAMLYEEDDSPREEGYRVLSVMMVENLQRRIEELNAFKGNSAPRYDLPQFDFSATYFPCE